MFVRNATALDVSLARGHVTDDQAIAAVVVRTVLRVEGERLVPLDKPVPVGEADPPPELGRMPLWSGVSVTAAGSAVGPDKPPYVCPVIFRVGAAERRLIVFGDRRWERQLGGALEATPPAPFEQIALSFTRAFGGGYDLPPGILPGTGLPHPGVRVIYPLNEHGVGYYPDERAATNAPLPNVERPDQLLRRWNDAPEPAGFTPCPDLVAWRMRAHAMTLQGLPDPQNATALLGDLATALRVYHHAPPPLIFADVSAGTPVALYGLGEAVRFAVPAPATEVTVRLRKVDTKIRCRLRALHVDSDRRLVCTVHDHSFRYDPRYAPSWVRVAPIPGEVS